MNPKRTAPAAIIDNLNYIENPFKQKYFSTDRYLPTKLPGSEIDLEYVLKFLYSYNGSTATFNSYRRDLERLLQWCWRIEKTSLLNLKREHIEDFIHFCFNPPKAWIGIKNVARFKNIDAQRLPNCDWRPFVVSVTKSERSNNKVADTKAFYPSQAAIKATFTAISSFYEYLIQENLVESNPVALIKQKSKFIRKDQLKPIVRRISTLQWDYVVETAELMASENPGEHERTLFIMNCLFAMYLRISELVADERSTPIMCHFRKDNDSNWWFDVTGKGNKNRSITVCDDMLNSLKRYRKYLGLSELPHINEQIPLISKTKGKGSITSTRQIRSIVQRCFDATYERMKADGLKADAIELKTATVHWLRHTGISEDVKFRPREHVRDDAGHASMATTDRYIDSDLRERHESGRKKRIKDIY
ncbi:Site specific recombinase, phage integrase [hydrothermal vent metagenome]|uniref:Site specific recombinase, phage integrase n=1 Tax=hydrothermal vent metagenome TaxID=652676 RepID=A0A3B0X706_9ZZZZ